MSATEFFVRAKDKIRAHHIDCVICATGTFAGCLTMPFSADSIFNYYSPAFVESVRIFAPAISTTCINLLAFRNKTYAKWMSNKE